MLRNGLIHVSKSTVRGSSYKGSWNVPVLNGSYSWCPTDGDSRPYFEIDLGKSCILTLPFLVDIWNILIILTRNESVSRKRELRDAGRLKILWEILSWVSKKLRNCTDYTSLSSGISLDKLQHLFTWTGTKLWPITTWSRVFSRASGRVIARTYDFIGTLRLSPLFWLAVVISLALVLQLSITNLS